MTIAIGEAKPLKLELVRILGKVELSGEPGTRVRIDDERGAIACVLPCTIDLPPGPHIAYFERPGFTVSPQSFAIVENKTVRSNASAVAVVGSLLVSADEAERADRGRRQGARVHAGGACPNIPIGHRKVRVSLRGYQPVEREVEVRINAQTDLRDVVLTPERSVSAASRETEAIEDAPASVTVISAQELEAFAYPTILEALRGVRGYAVNFDSVYGNAAVRGLGQANDFSNRLLVLSDGAVLNENILYQPFIHYDGRSRPRRRPAHRDRARPVVGAVRHRRGVGRRQPRAQGSRRARGRPRPDLELRQLDRARAGSASSSGSAATPGCGRACRGRARRAARWRCPATPATGLAARTTQGFDKFHTYTVTGKTVVQGPHAAVVLDRARGHDPDRQLRVAVRRHPQLRRRPAAS